MRLFKASMISIAANDIIATPTNKRKKLVLINVLEENECDWHFFYN